MARVPSIAGRLRKLISFSVKITVLMALMVLDSPRRLKSSAVRVYSACEPLSAKSEGRGRGRESHEDGLGA